jgi:hypothetical protein
MHHMVNIPLLPYVDFLRGLFCILEPLNIYASLFYMKSLLTPYLEALANIARASFLELELTWSQGPEFVALPYLALSGSKSWLPRASQSPSSEEGSRYSLRLKT